MDEQTLSLIPATEEDLQYLNPEPQSPELVPATEEDLQYITPEIREPTMQEMTSDFETFKMFRKAGAFDSGKTATEMVTEGLSGMASDLGHWAKTLPIRLAQNFADDKYSFNRKAKAQAKATTLQILGNLELDYKSIGAGISRGVDKVFGEAETEEDLRSSYEFFKTQADLEKQRQGKAAEMVTEGFLGMSPEFLTLGMPEEQRELIRSQQVMPDMKAARGGTLPADPLNFVPLGAAVNVAKGTGRATLKGAEKVLINETLQLAKLKDDMTKALSRVGDNTIKSRRLAIKQAPVKARLEKGLAEVTEKIAENQAKLKPLAAKRDMALTKLASDLPVGNPLKEFLNDALKEVPIKQPLNLTNKVGGTGLVAVGKPIEYLGNALQFVKTLPQETAINMLMKAGEKAGVEVTEQQANALIKSGVIGGVGYGGYSFAGEFTDSELGKLGGAVGALLGPQFLARFGRNTAILGRETMKPASDLPFFTRLASKDAEKMTTQLIDRTALVPIESVARQVTGAAEGKILSRMGGPEAFGRMSPGGQATVNFLDRTGLGRYVESAGRMAKGVGAGGTVGGAFGLAASGGMDMPEAFYGGIGAGMLFGSAGAVGGEVARFTSPINHMEARYGDLYHYAENYLPAGQKESFNKLNRDVQMAVANKIVANPSLAIEYVSKGKDGEGGYFDRVTGDIVINVDSPRAIEPLLAHEFTHYLEQTGGKRKFIDLLIGNPMTGKPGIFVQRVTKQNKSKYPDLKVGDPIMVGEGANRKFLLSDEFETARSDYGKKLQDTLLDSDGNKMSDSDLAKIMTDEQTVSEIVAEHGTDFLLNDKRKYRDRNRGTIGKIMGGMLDTELVQNIPLLRKTLAMMGGTFRPDGQLITDNKLFSNLKRYPQITELVRKYNNQLEGMSPQKRQALETSGRIQGRDIKSGGRSTKEVVVDIKSAELAKSPQLAELLRSGTLLQIDKDGNVIPNLAMTSREQGKYNRSFAEKMKEAIEEKEANEGLPEGHVRPEVNPKTGKIRFVGRYLDDSVIDKLEQSGNWNKEQMQTLRDVNFNIRNKGGNEYLISYFKAAGQGGGKYVNAKVENHIEVPYGFEITQKNNIILRTVSVNQLVKNIDQLARQQQAELTRLYGADVAQAKIKLLQDLDKYHRNHADGQPGKTGLDANKDIAKAKADFINSAFGSGTKAEAGSNPWRASLGKKNPRDVYRSRRIERIGKMDQLSGTRFIDYDKINKAFIPAYHGTPHTFSAEPGAPLGRFRTSAIGTGEGAQAYGHGLYFAGRREVAEFYREQLAPTITKDFKVGTMNIFKDEVPMDYSPDKLERVYGKEANARASLIEELMIDEGTIRRAFIEDGEKGAKREVKKVIESFLDSYEGEADYIKVGKKALDMPVKFDTTEPGSLYKVELAPKENEYLLWDKPLSEQPKGVREKIEKGSENFDDLVGYSSVQEMIDAGGLSRLFNNDGGSFYDTLSRELGGPKASATLKEAGIPGIKYLDGSSRNQATFKITPPSQTVSGKYMVKGDDYNSKGKHFDTKAEAEKYLQEQLDKLDYNYVIFDEADVQITDKLFMPAGGDKLTATHNLSAEALAKADELGGLPVPSVGITKGRALEGFGEVTLLGTRPLVDPELGVPAFGSDVYSKRFPREKYKPVKMKKADDFVAKYKPFANETGGHELSLIFEALVNSPDLGDAKWRFMSSDFAKMAFLKDKGKPVRVPKKKESVDAIVDQQLVNEVSGLAKLYENIRPNDPEWKQYSKYLKDAFNRSDLAKKDKFIRDTMLENLFDENNLANFGPGDRILRDIRKFGNMVIDKSKLRDRIEKKFTKNLKAEYEKWATQEIASLFDDPYIVVDGKKVPLTLDTATDSMTGRIRAVEKNMTFGPGEARSMGSPKFSNIQEMRNRSDVLVSKEKFDSYKDNVQDPVHEAFRESAMEAYKYSDGWTSLDLSYRALGQYLQSFKGSSKQRMRSALRKYDFIPNDSLVEKAIKAAEVLRDAPTEYFEAKPQRAVKLEEFAGAIMPKKANPKIKELADKYGWEVKTYDPNKPETRQTAVRQLANRLQRQGKEVLFMPTDPKAPKRQPANRITRQAPAMPGNRFMLPAASAGAKSAERFR